MKYLLILIFAICFKTGNAQNKDATWYYSQAMDAYRAKSYQTFYEMITEAHKLHPYHQGIYYQLGVAGALTGRGEEAVANLKKAILINAGFKLEGLSDFNTIKETPGFRSLVALQKENQSQEIHSDTAFIVRDRSLHVEGIGYDPLSKAFYLGSIHKRKIVKVTSNSESTDFCKESFDGMTSIFGVKVDAGRNLLWACSSPMAEMSHYDSSARSAVFKFDLATGKLVSKFSRPTWDKDGVFGDLVISGKGEVFVSDSKTNTIFTVNEKTGKLEPYYTSPDFWNIQGLCFSVNDRYLFIADYIKGVFRLDLKTKTLKEIPSEAELSLKGIDGLSYYNGSLIAVQNGVAPARAVRLYLSPGLDKIVRFQTLDRNHPSFNEPTQGIVVGNSFYYIANSQWGGYDDKHQLKPDSELQDIVVLKCGLNH